MNNPGISRRTAVGIALAGTAGAVVTGGAKAATATSPSFDQEFDVVICGGGGGGLAAALFTRWEGHTVTVLEKGASVGGTSAKAAFWYWVPNNPGMQALGLRDEKPDFLRLIGRLTDPDGYDPEAPRFGLSQWQYDMAEAFYDSASEAVQLLDAKGALPTLHVPDVPDYWAELPENKAPRGRVMVPRGIDDARSDGGRVAIRNMVAAARRDGIAIKTSHRVDKVIQDSTGRAIGVEVSTDDGVLRIRARKAVLFASGGFTHDENMRKNFLALPVLGGCAALTNEGDIIRATDKVGVQLANMKNAWLAPIPLEKAAAKDGAMVSTFAMTGDSMIIVNKHGIRVADEKQPYNELARAFGIWDGAKSEHPNLVLISIWDQRAQNKCASPFFGSLIVPPGADDRHVIRGATLEELAVNCAKRLDALHAIVSTRLASDFLENLKATIDRFNSMAVNGKDSDFARGERAFSLYLSGPAKEQGQKNPTMWPISASGPYYATLIVAGTLDTKGGPKTDTETRMLDAQDNPIPGLYGVGNCVAAASGAAYWAGGGTIGPILAFALRASKAITKDSAGIAGLSSRKEMIG